MFPGGVVSLDACCFRWQQDELQKSMSDMATQGDREHWLKAVLVDWQEAREWTLVGVAQGERADSR